MNGVMVQQFSLNLVQRLVNSKWKLKLDKLVLMFQSLFHYLCFLSLVLKSHFWEIYISMERILFTFTPNRKLYLVDLNWRKKTLQKLPLFSQLQQNLHEDNFILTKKLKIINKQFYFYINLIF